MNSIEVERHQIYDGICAVAAHCDGAVTLDGQGFDGQDTHFGRRIAAVSYDAWTEDVHQEAARIASKYQKQILAYTGVDASQLQVVRDALGLRTNQAARDEARAYERRAKGASKTALRKVDVVEGKLAIFYDRKDPDFNALLDIMRVLPGRYYNGIHRCNEVDPSDELEDFILVWDFPITPAADAILRQPRAPKSVKYEITLHENGEQVVIDTDLTARQPGLGMVQALPGRSFDRASCTNRAAIHADVIAFAHRLHLGIAPDALEACEHAQEALQAKEAAALAEGDLKTLVAHVSDQQNPDTLPPAFMELLEGVLARYGAEGAIIR
jgi:hypothetical protein